MKKMVFGLFIVVACLGQLNAQELSYFPGMWSTEYYQDNEKITSKEFESLLESNPTSFELWQKHEKQMIIGGVVSLAELGLAIWTFSDLINDRNAWGPGLGTIGAGIIAAIILNKAFKNKKEAVLNYNDGLDQKTSFKIEPSKRGLGIVLSF